LAQSTPKLGSCLRARSVAARLCRARRRAWAVAHASRAGAIAKPRSNAPFTSLTPRGQTRLNRLLAVDLSISHRERIRVGIVGLSATGGWAATAHVPALAALTATN